MDRTTCNENGAEKDEATEWTYKRVESISRSNKLPNFLPDYLGTYSRAGVSGCDKKSGKLLFDLGLRHMLNYQHELASDYFSACLDECPNCIMAHGMIALCHGPNYNFQGQAYYRSTASMTSTSFPSQYIAQQHSIIALKKCRKLQRERDDKKDLNDTDTVLITKVEESLIDAIRILTRNIIDSASDTEIEVQIGRPFSDAMRKIHHDHPHDKDVAYWFAESLMVLNAWNLYSNSASKNDVIEIEKVLESSLSIQEDEASPSYHVGLCHLFIHLCEMSSKPDRALPYCKILREGDYNGGHLLHMGTHIDVLLGEYERTVLDNERAIVADKYTLRMSPETAGPTTFYFAYMVHNYHMAVYGALLGGMEQKATEIAHELLTIYLTEDLFQKHPALTAYLEAYATLDIHVLIRFGRWHSLLKLPFPKNRKLMFTRTATLLFGRGLAFANLNRLEEAKQEARKYDDWYQRKDDSDNDDEQKNGVRIRILHNNMVHEILNVDSPMLHGEIAYRTGENYEEAFRLLRKAVKLSDDLNYDEPEGKMQPIRHALGGLLLEQKHIEEAIVVFRQDLQMHPNNPFALFGLIQSLEQQQQQQLFQSLDINQKSNFGCGGSSKDNEIQQLKIDLAKQQQCEWADFRIDAACACCSLSFNEEVN